MTVVNDLIKPKRDSASETPRVICQKEHKKNQGTSRMKLSNDMAQTIKLSFVDSDSAKLDSLKYLPNHQNNDIATGT